MPNTIRKRDEWAGSGRRKRSPEVLRSTAYLQRSASFRVACSLRYFLATSEALPKERGKLYDCSQPRKRTFSRALVLLHRNANFTGAAAEDYLVTTSWGSGSYLPTRSGAYTL